MYTTEQLTRRWEDQRAVKNLMGKFANTVILNREQEIFSRFWSENEPTLAFNDGVYRGVEAVKAYYEACRCRNALVASLLQKRFPERLGGMSEEEIYVGTIRETVHDKLAVLDQLIFSPDDGV
ncbi:MAG: hypothetical protein IKD79_05410, partial [Oscillospiraceae bacterium]|nr:hypothetical protein [Oscillospiraceae bacterium]